MKRLFYLLILIISFLISFICPVNAEGEQIKVLSLNYDNSSSIVSISTTGAGAAEGFTPPQKYIALANPNRIYFDINNAILVGEKQQILFEKSPIKEIRLAQFNTNPFIVRAVITFEEKFDTSKVKLICSGGNIIAKIKTPVIKNDYFDNLYNDEPESEEYSSITASSQIIKKVEIPAAEVQTETSDNTVNEIKQAFENSTLPNTDGKTYDSVISVDLSSKLKMRTKYYINQYIPKNDGLLISGIGQISTARMFYLNSPKRAVIDLPNAYLAKDIRNKEVNLCPNGACKDVAKIGQFEFNKARIVITSEDAEKYIPVFSPDSQSVVVVNADKLNHTALSNIVSNLNKAFIRRIDSKTSELILSFTAPVTHSIIRTDTDLKLYLFNVKSYNEQDILKTVNNTAYKQLNISLLPQIGIKAGLNISKKDVVKIDKSVDSKALKITIKRVSNEEIRANDKPSRKNKVKSKVVIDAGHGGTDYGAIREGVNEKDIVLDITKRVETILRSKGFKVALTRKDDTYVSLEDRVAFAEDEEPEIFVSIHVNSAVSTTPNGIETHWYHEYSKPLAEIIHKHFIKEIPDANDRGLFKSKFYVINHTTMPAVLCEIGFLSNDEERNKLISDERKQKTAKAIANGIIEYIGGLK